MDLAALWGFDLGAYAFNYSGNQDQFPSTSHASVDTGIVSCHTLLQSPSQTVGSPGLSKVEYLTSRSSTEQKAGLKSKHSKVGVYLLVEENYCTTGICLFMIQFILHFLT